MNADPAVTPTGLTLDDRRRVVELLVSAHLYAASGVIVPFRAACSKHQELGTPTAKHARTALDAILTELELTPRPPPAEYTRAIKIAAERVASGDLL